MKKIITAAALILVIASCTKKDTIEPETIFDL